MAPKLPPCKICSIKDVGKYRCPVCGIDYCSVPCFKTHKASSCSTPDLYISPALPSHPVIQEDDSLDDERPRKRLKDVKWPLEPDESLWGNPLNRDDVKPLRGFEYQALATSPHLRAILSSPSLRQTLTRLSDLPSNAREASLRLLLSLPPDPAPTVYRPSLADKFSTSSQGFTNDGRGRGGSRGRGRGRGGGRGGAGSGTGREDGLIKSTPEERLEVERFVESVFGSLEEVRGERK